MDVLSKMFPLMLTTVCPSSFSKDLAETYYGNMSQESVIRSIYGTEGTNGGSEETVDDAAIAHSFLSFMAVLCEQLDSDIFTIVKYWYQDQEREIQDQDKEIERKNALLLPLVVTVNGLANETVPDLASVIDALNNDANYHTYKKKLTESGLEVISVKEFNAITISTYPEVAGIPNIFPVQLKFENVDSTMNHLSPTNCQKFQKIVKEILTSIHNETNEVKEVD